MCTASGGLSKQVSSFLSDAGLLNESTHGCSQTLNHAAMRHRPIYSTIVLCHTISLLNLVCVQTQLRDHPGLRIQVEGVDDQCFGHTDQCAWLGNMQFVAIFADAPAKFAQVALLEVLLMLSSAKTFWCTRGLVCTQHIGCFYTHACTLLQESSHPLDWHIVTPVVLQKGDYTWWPRLGMDVKHPQHPDWSMKKCLSHLTAGINLRHQVQFHMMLACMQHSTLQLCIIAFTWPTHTHGRRQHCCSSEAASVCRTQVHCCMQQDLLCCSACMSVAATCC